MEITKQNEHYQITDSTESYNITGSLDVNLDGTYSFNINMVSTKDSSNMNYYKIVNANRININYDVSNSAVEEDLLNYVKDNMQTILDKVNKQ
nr:MAG TPA: hypothetical protein [Bacteriophage sp.]